jgi:hypothetical protein
VPDSGEGPDLGIHLIIRGNVAVKAWLLDQYKIAGVGNLLADEAFWQAKISPTARTNRLRPAEAAVPSASLRCTPGLTGGPPDDSWRYLLTFQRGSCLNRW